MAGSVRSLALKLHEWWLARIRRELIVKAHHAERSRLAAPPMSGPLQQTHSGRASRRQKFDQLTPPPHEQQAGRRQSQDGGAARRGVRAHPHLT